MSRRGKIYETGFCYCGNIAHKIKSGSWVCERCDWCENHAPISTRPQMIEWEEREAVRQYRRELYERRLHARRTAQPNQPGPLGILIEGYGVYAM